MDGKPHNIQLYAHMQPGLSCSYFTGAHVDSFSQGFFFATDSVQNMTWSTVSSVESVSEMAQLRNPQPLSENAQGQAEWGQFYFATAQVRFLLGYLPVVRT